MIHAGDVVVGLFSSIGWTWGGTFRNAKDYQHFSASGRLSRPVRTSGSRAQPAGHASGWPAPRHAAAATAANTASEPFTGSPSSGSIVTSILGMSTARRMPNERIVRSSGAPGVVDGEALAAHPAERHVGGADAVRAQHDLVERRRRTGPSPRTAPSPSIEAVAAAPARASAPRPVRSPSDGEPAPRPRPSRRPGGRAEVGGPATSTSSTTKPGGDGARSHVGDAGACARRARRRCRRAADAGGERRALRPEAHDVLPASSTRTGAAVLVGQPAGHGAPPRWPALPPNAPPLASGVAGSPPGRAPRRVGLEVGGLDPGRAQGPGPVAGRQRRAASVSRAVVRRPCTLPAAARASASVSPTTQSRRRASTATRASAGAVSSAKPPRPRATSGPDPLARCRPRARPAGAAAARSRGRRGGDAPERGQGRLLDRLPAGAAAEVGEERLVDRGPSASATPLPPSAARRTMIPGVQKPHWLAPVAQNASAQRSRVGVEALEGRDRPPGHPAGRASRRPPAADRRPARCSSRTGPAGCSRPWPSGRRAGRAAPRAARRRRRRPRPAARPATKAMPLATGPRLGSPHG